MQTSVIDSLRREHSNMRSVLNLVNSQLDRLEHGEPPDYVLLANALYYMRKFPSQVHHPKEDLIFDRLVVGDSSYKQEVERIREQHQQIYELEEWLIEMTLNNPIKGSSALKRLIEFGRHYLQLQREHCVTEEKTLFPRATEVLTKKDWGMVSRLIEDIDDPLFGKHKGERFESLYDYIMRESSGV
jgi:hemerythrin-like domain-containing protein